jgi:hypothetical protein
MCGMYVLAALMIIMATDDTRLCIMSLAIGVHDDNQYLKIKLIMGVQFRHKTLSCLCPGNCE